MTHHIVAPVNDAVIAGLRAGDEVLISGVLYTARDAAHKRLHALLTQGKPLPVDLSGQTVYYTGPAPAPAGSPIGSAGPTTSSRMDAYTPLLIEKAGVRAMIGKGGRCQAVKKAMRRFGCVYFAAIGGAGALLAQRVVSAQVVCFDDLGPEAVRRLHVQDFPAIVAIDTQGNDLYSEGPRKWRR